MKKIMTTLILCLGLTSCNHEQPNGEILEVNDTIVLVKQTFFDSFYIIRSINTPVIKYKCKVNIDNDTIEYISDKKVNKGDSIYIKEK